MARAVRSAVEVKIGVVAADEREGDRRRLLNLGHTLGHALETVIGLGKLRHGDAVGHGMLFATALAERRGLASEVAGRIRALVGRLDLATLPDLEPGLILKAIERDKKARESGVAWVLPTEIGGAEVVELSSGLVEYELASFLKVSVE
jgi:3-dehydroquinate synthase